jgi:hypothetical protein
LAAAAGAALTPDGAADRWGAVLEAVAYSPVRTMVVPAGYPDPVSAELKAAVTGVAALVPDIARHLGVEPPPEGSRAARPPRRPTGPKKPKPAGGAKRIPAPPTVATAPVADEQQEAAAVTEHTSPLADAPDETVTEPTEATADATGGTVATHVVEPADAVEPVEPVETTEPVEISEAVEEPADP